MPSSTSRLSAPKSRVFFVSTLVTATSVLLYHRLITSQSCLLVQAFPIASPFGFAGIRRLSRHNKNVLQQSSSTTGSFESAPSSSSPSTSFSRSPINSAAESKSISAEASSASATLRQAAILDLPWNDRQRWALCDKVGRYIIQVVVDTENEATAITNNRETYILWRNLVHDTPELQGYPLQFLSERLRDEVQRNREEIKNHETPSVSLSPLLLEQSWESSTTCATILPYLDQFRFEPNGGLSGLVYGVPGVADGSRIQTTPVGNVEVTIPQNYVRTGSILYELGQPSSESFMLMNEISTGSSKHWQPDGKELAASLVAMTTSDARIKPANAQGNSILDPELVNLAALTAVVLVGAAAVEKLSHHLTVNIFWV